MWAVTVQISWLSSKDKHIEIEFNFWQRIHTVYFWSIINLIFFLPVFQHAIDVSDDVVICGESNVGKGELKFNNAFFTFVA